MGLGLGGGIEYLLSKCDKTCSWKRLYYAYNTKPVRRRVCSVIHGARSRKIPNYHLFRKTVASRRCTERGDGSQSQRNRTRAIPSLINLDKPWDCYKGFEWLGTDLVYVIIIVFYQCYTSDRIFPLSNMVGVLLIDDSSTSPFIIVRSDSVPTSFPGGD